MATNAAQVMYDGKWISTATNIGKEVLKFEKPYSYQEYPKMVFKAQRGPNGKVIVLEGPPDMAQTTWRDDLLAKEQNRIQFFNNSNQKTVGDESEHKAALNAGWRDHPDDAIKHYEERELAISDATAERHYADSKMSEKAQAEAAEVDNSTEFHVPFIPEKKKGRSRTA